MKKVSISGFVALVTVALLATINASAQYVPYNLEDLVNIRASSGEEALKARGYEFRHVSEGSDRKWSYWWNEKKKECITVVTYDGRYTSIIGSPEGDCNMGTIHSSNLSGKLPPDEVADLVDVRASSGESVLKQRGYHLTTLHKDSDRTYGYWWNPNKIECLCVITKDGRYASLDYASAVDCNQTTTAHPVEPVKAEKGKNAGTGIAIAAIAAAAIGAAVLMNKSHHHDDNKHYDDAKLEESFERGYRDGMYNNPYHNYGNNDNERKAYTDGYNSGVDQRKHDTEYHPGYGGYNQYVNVADLQGKSASWAEEQFYRRGFRMVDSYFANGANHSFFYNNNTGQCVEAEMVNNYYRTIRRGNNRNCRN